MSNSKKRKLEERLKHSCCNGYVYYDGRAGDDAIFIHTDECPVGQQEKAEQDYWDMEGR